MVGSDQREQFASFPEWKMTDWTPRQRAAAIVALLILGGSCALIAWAFAQWGDGPPTWDTYAPIGMTLYCVGTTLLAYTYWYAYKHAHYGATEQATTARVFYGMFLIEALVAVLFLALELVGRIVVVMVGWADWRIYGPLSFWIPTAICLFFGAILGIGASMLSWRPTRDPAAVGCVVGTPVTGARLTLRWLVMVLASNSWLLLAGPTYILFSLWGALNVEGQAGTQVVTRPAPVFAIVAVLFLLTALVEMLPVWLAAMPESE